MRLASAEPGDYLVREGDPSPATIVVVSGWVYRHKLTRSGARQILSVHMSGDVIGLDSGVVDLLDHNVQVLARAQICSIPRQAMLDLANAMPNVGRALWREAVVDTSIAREWMVSVGQRDARQRIAHLFCELAVRQHPSTMSDGYEIECPLTQEQLGDATGLTSVHVNRTIQALRRAGLIRVQRNKAVILDWAMLQSAGDFSRSYLHMPARAATSQPSIDRHMIG